MGIRLKQGGFFFFVLNLHIFNCVSVEENVCAHECERSWKPEASDTFQAGVTGGFELPCGYWEPNRSPL